MNSLTKFDADCTSTKFNPLKTKLVQIIFKNSVRTAKKTLHFTITKINWLTLFKKIIAVYTENHTKPLNTKCCIADCWSRWYIWLPLGFKGLNILFTLVSSRRCPICVSVGFACVIVSDSTVNITAVTKTAKQHYAQSELIVIFHKLYS
jgi:hypothetical protein